MASKIGASVGAMGFVFVVLFALSALAHSEAKPTEADSTITDKVNRRNIGNPGYSLSTVGFWLP